MSEKQTFRTKFSKRERVSAPVSDLPSCTNQQWADETNINYIMKNCTADSLSYNLKIANAQLAFGEMIEAGQQLNLLYEHTKQKEEFNCLPPEIRKEYNYDFKQFLIESTTKEGLEKLANLGLISKSILDVPTEDVPIVDNGTSADINEQIENI